MSRLALSTIIVFVLAVTFVALKPAKIILSKMGNGRSQQQVGVVAAEKSARKSNEASNQLMFANSSPQNSENNVLPNEIQVIQSATTWSAEAPEYSQLNQSIVDELSELTSLPRVDELEIVPDSYEITYEADDGGYEAKFLTTDGSSVYQWVNSDGSLRIEERNYGERGTVKTWYARGEDRETIVEYTRGKFGAQSGYYANNQQKFQRFWDDTRGIDYREDF